MRLIDHLGDTQKTGLRALRNRLHCREGARRRRRDPQYLARQREYMRGYRADVDRRLLCPGIDLPIDAGTCGAMISPQSSRCLKCHNRREWLLRHMLNRAELNITTMLEYSEDLRRAGAQTARTDAGEAETDHPPAGERRWQHTLAPLLDEVEHDGSGQHARPVDIERTFHAHRARTLATGGDHDDACLRW